MKGLRTQENDKFKRFFKLVQNEAKQKGFVFFMDCGQGKVYENEDVECEDLCGWLIPEKDSSEFNQLFLEGSEQQHSFDAVYCYVDFTIDEQSGKIQIDIDDTPDDTFDDLHIDDFNILQNNMKIIK